VTALDLRSLFDFCLFTTSWVVGLKDSEAGLFSPDMVADMYMNLRNQILSKGDTRCEWFFVWIAQSNISEAAAEGGLLKRGRSNSKVEHAGA
jgi:hypothetical protein